MYRLRISRPTRSATPGWVKGSAGAAASPRQETTPTSMKPVNSFLRQPSKSPNTPSTGASSATMAMAALVA